MICKKCDSIMRPMAKGRRVIYFFHGRSELYYPPRYRCVDCKCNRQAEIEEAPYQSSYSWEVIEKVIELRRDGGSVRHLRAVLISEYGITVPTSTLRRMISRYGPGTLVS